jgi:hypothetical protein
MLSPPTMALQFAFVSASAKGTLMSEVSALRDLLEASTLESKLSFVQLVLHALRHGREQDAPSFQAHFELLSIAYHSIPPSLQASYKKLVFENQKFTDAPLVDCTGTYVHQTRVSPLTRACRDVPIRFQHSGSFQRRGS